jgi:SAM-dependent methyltransferase
MLKDFIKRLPVVGPAAAAIHRMVRPKRFSGSKDYWEERYQSGGDSGPGSYGPFAEFKAEVLNGLVREHGIRSVIEFGCGDGNQLTLAQYPSYTGYDVSETALTRCRTRFAGDATKRFRPMRDYDGEQAELALSLDVVYHLVEDEVFETYMRTLFAASTRFVVVLASDRDDIPMAPADHVRHRQWTPWVARNMPEWQLARHVENRYPYRGDSRTGSFADFYVFQRAIPPTGA